MKLKSSDLSTKSFLLQKNSASTKLVFSKFHASGNDFILIDDRSHSFCIDDITFIKKLCERSFGIGADGVVLLRQSQVADFSMRIFNSDGFEARMCGNGLRCLISFIKKLQLFSQSVSIETQSGIHECSLQGDRISISFSSPKNIQLDYEIEIENKKLFFHLINTGVDHAIYFTPLKEDKDFLPIAKAVRHHKDFAPVGVNVSFVYQEKDRLILKTFEKGVEKQTLACGTAAMATSIIAYRKLSICPPVVIEFSSLDRVICDFSLKGGSIENPTLSGFATHVFDGNLSKY